MCEHENVGIDRYHEYLTETVNQIADRFPPSLGQPRLKALPFEAVALETEAFIRLAAELAAQSFLHDLTKRPVFPSGLSFGAIEQVICNFDGRVHMATHITMNGEPSMDPWN